jgi:hypothetical protein
MAYFCKALCDNHDHGTCHCSLSADVYFSPQEEICFHWHQIQRSRWSLKYNSSLQSLYEEGPIKKNISANCVCAPSCIKHKCSGHSCRHVALTCYLPLLQQSRPKITVKKHVPPHTYNNSIQRGFIYNMGIDNNQNDIVMTVNIPRQF